MPPAENLPRPLPTTPSVTPYHTLLYSAVMVRRVATLVVGLSLLWSSPSRAQSESQCPKSPEDGLDFDTVVISPPSKAAATVARNTLIRVDIRADLNPQLGLLRVVPAPDGNDTYLPVPATWQQIASSDRFVIRPAELLAAETTYSVLARADTGLGPGAGDFQFRTSDVIDTQPPDFKFGQDRVTGVSSVECGEDGNRRVSITFARATDDGDEGGIEYLLYLTRASGLDAPRLLAREYLASGSGSMSFALRPEQLATPVCILVDVEDGVGNHAEGIDEFCFDPLQGSFFEPCSVARHSSPRHVGFLVWLIVASLALRVRSHRLRARADGRATLT